MAYSRFSLVLSPRRHWCAALFLLAWAGCDQPEIQEYKVKRIINPSIAAEEVRLFGAIFPRDGTSWFFKLIGPVDAVKPVEPEVRTFLRSVRFEGDDPPKYQVPQSWKPGRGNQF